MRGGSRQVPLLQCSAISRTLSWLGGPRVLYLNYTFAQRLWRGEVGEGWLRLHPFGFWGIWKRDRQVNFTRQRGSCAKTQFLLLFSSKMLLCPRTWVRRLSSERVLRYFWLLQSLRLDLWGVVTCSLCHHRSDDRLKRSHSLFTLPSTVTRPCSTFLKNRTN